MPDLSFIAIALAIIYCVAFALVYRILLTYRTAQGAIAWIIALLSLPYLAIPLFAFFGRNRFAGYVHARRMGEQSLSYLANQLEQEVGSRCRPGLDSERDELQVLSILANQPFTDNNQCTLLKDGASTFDALFEAMEDARNYILMEFYLVRSDRVGQRIKSILKRKLAQGVKVYFLYDDIGSVWLPRRYLAELNRAGAQVASFGDGDYRRRRLQLNFRNHRKLLICDGETGFVGGLNLGDEYLGTSMDRSPWRDTHCRLRGPAVLGLQLAWLEDWQWASNVKVDLSWQPVKQGPGRQEVLVLPSGPADPFETCTLFFLNCINNARSRLWIASPYFVPDVQIVNALQLAALRGVDVRILIPEKSDNLFIRLATYSYLVQACRAGIGVYQYKPGFMHQKVMLVDERYAAVGTANLDNRSMRLNFEITALSTGADFVRDVSQMLTDDLDACRQMTPADYQQRSRWFRLACRGARLMAPVL